MDKTEKLSELQEQLNYFRQQLRGERSKFTQEELIKYQQTIKVWNKKIAAVQQLSF